MLKGNHKTSNANNLTFSFMSVRHKIQYHIEGDLSHIHQDEKKKKKQKKNRQIPLILRIHDFMP